ncbi:hypothetical protein H6S82_15915 [Planktothrix sp. FACHB-1355]|uniref:Rhamnogalacturonase A/B/Epimerase-like pectate lyase domain-containing protein n=1 Tax=Aerosakkonema funiforme FACHB-1375 TaxID=2949571 RepID=A0A926VM10_9CYAN|nr:MULTISPECIES: glycosyl hydrolase family 28-related protein [Oscillatoriales]MBD2186371.1 hypothetical protein [Aerosakkonema funiforme FACHB-1375]MBD3560328.1 hypothetical protein [Planktothrix sp. FACHB-1355]
MRISRKALLKYFLLSLLGAGFVLILFGGSTYLFSSKQNVVRSSSSIAVNLSSTCGSPKAGPTDNPVAAKYGVEAYPWTENIKWNCVYNINDFKGSTIVEQFNAARDVATANGGGVVYFPSGTYTFTDSIFLKNGVVIRGDTPSGKDAKSDSYKPPTKFIFSKYEPTFSGNGTPNNTAFKKIFTTAPESDSNIGIVNVDINRGGIKLSGDIDTGKKQNIVIFGIRSNNVADPSPQVPDISFQEPWMRYSDRFAANITINAFANVLVANNRLNDAITDNYEQPAYKIKPLEGNEIITYAEGSKVPFHYGNHYGIVVNRSKPEGFTLAAEPNTEPGLFRKGIVIRDNWVFHTMRIGIQASGDGLLIKDNQISDQPNKEWWTDPTGTKQPRGAVTYENRAIDWSGYNVQIEGNNYQVYRHRVMDTAYLSVDGEGILIQECCGGTKINGVTIVKNEGNAYIGLYKIPSTRNVRISDNKVLSNVSDIASIYVEANTNNRSSSMENVIIENNTVAGTIAAKANLGGKGNIIRNNIGNNSGTIKYSCNITVQGNTGFAQEPCLNLQSSNQQTQ